jgi:hypothetical protein
LESLISMRCKIGNIFIKVFHEAFIDIITSELFFSMREVLISMMVEYTLYTTYTMEDGNFYSMTTFKSQAVYAF